MTMAPDMLRLKGLGRRKMEQLVRKAERMALTPEGYLKRLVEDDLAISKEARTKTFAEIMGRGKAVDEEGVDRIVERAKSRHFAKTRKGRRGTACD
jgi:hypothetical protein